MYQEFFDIQAMSEKHDILQISIWTHHMKWLKQWQYIVDLQKEFNYLVVLLFF